MNDAQLTIDEHPDQTWDEWFRSLPRTPTGNVSSPSALGSSRSVGSRRVPEGRPSHRVKSEFGYQPNTETKGTR